MKVILISFCLISFNMLIAQKMKMDSLLEADCKRYFEEDKIYNLMSPISPDDLEVIKESLKATFIDSLSFPALKLNDFIFKIVFSLIINNEGRVITVIPNHYLQSSDLTKMASSPEYFQSYMRIFNFYVNHLEEKFYQWKFSKLSSYSDALAYLDVIVIFNDLNRYRFVKYYNVSKK